MRLLAVAFPLGRITGREVIPKHKCKHLRYSCVLHFDRGEAVTGCRKRCETVQGKARRSMGKPSARCVVLKSTCVDLRNDVHR